MDVVRNGFKAWSSGGLDALIEFLDPDIGWAVRPDFPDAGVFRGHHGVTRLFTTFGETFDDTTHEPLGFIDAGDQVVVPLEWSGRGKGSGVEVAERRGETWVFTVRDGKITAITEYRLREEALEAAGLADQLR